MQILNRIQGKSLFNNIHDTAIRYICQIHNINTFITDGRKYWNEDMILMWNNRLGRGVKEDKLLDGKRARGRSAVRCIDSGYIRVSSKDWKRK